MTAIRVGPADKTYIHRQLTPSALWTVTHNLGKFVSVTVEDSAGNKVEGDVHYDSENRVTISFGSAFSGRAFCN